MVAEESRTRVSEFDASAGTVQFGQTVYNQLLSDMGLNIAEAAPGPTAAVEPVREPKPAPTPTPVEGAKRNTTKWVVAIAALLVLGAAALVVIVSLFIYLRWERL